MKVLHQAFHSPYQRLSSYHPLRNGSWPKSACLIQGGVLLEKAKRPKPLGWLSGRLFINASTTIISWCSLPRSPPRPPPEGAADTREPQQPATAASPLAALAHIDSVPGPTVDAVRIVHWSDMCQRAGFLCSTSRTHIGLNPGRKVSIFLK